MSHAPRQPSTVGAGGCPSGGRASPAPLPSGATLPHVVHDPSPRAPACHACPGDSHRLIKLGPDLRTQQMMDFVQRVRDSRTAQARRRQALQRVSFASVVQEESVPKLGLGFAVGNLLPPRKRALHPQVTVSDRFA